MGLKGLKAKAERQKKNEEEADKGKAPAGTATPSETAEENPFPPEWTSILERIEYISYAEDVTEEVIADTVKAVAELRDYLGDHDVPEPINAAAEQSLRALELHTAVLVNLSRWKDISTDVELAWSIVGMVECEDSDDEGEAKDDKNGDDNSKEQLYTAMAWYDILSLISGRFVDETDLDDDCEEGPLSHEKVELIKKELDEEVLESIDEELSGMGWITNWKENQKKRKRDGADGEQNKQAKGDGS